MDVSNVRPQQLVRTLQLAEMCVWLTTESLAVAQHNSAQKATAPALGIYM